MVEAVKGKYNKSRVDKGKEVLYKHKNKLFILAALVFPVVVINVLIYVLWFTIAIVLAVMFFMLIVFPYLGLTMGKEKAENEITNFDPNICITKEISDSYKCTYIVNKDGDTNSGVILQGLMIAKSKDYIAIWDGDTSTVYPLTKDEKIVVTAQLKINK